MKSQKVIKLDLLYSHIKDIPIDETLVGIYIIDGDAKYVSTKNNKNLYKLYRISEYSVEEFLQDSRVLGKFDSYIATIHAPIYQQSGRYENDIKIVQYITKNAVNKDIKRPVSERNAIERYITNNTKKLF